MLRQNRAWTHRIVRASLLVVPLAGGTSACAGHTDEDVEDVGMVEQGLGGCVPIKSDCPTCTGTLLYSEGALDPDPEVPLPFQTERIAIDHDDVYFTVCDADYTSCSVKRVGKDGTGARLLANIGSASGLNLEVDQNYVYVQGNCSFTTLSCPILRVPKNGGAAQVVTAQNVGLPGPLVIDANHIYWYAWDETSSPPSSLGIQRIRKNGTGQTTVVLDPEFNPDPAGYRVRMTLDGGQLYYSHGFFEHKIKRVAKSGGAPTLLFASAPGGGDSEELMVAGNNVYWLVSSPAPQSLWRMSKSGGSPAPIVTPPATADLDGIGATTDNAGNLIWGEVHPGVTRSNLVIKKRFKSTGNVVELAHVNDEPYLVPPFGRIKVDNKAVYFTAGPARLFRVNTCKPRR